MTVLLDLNAVLDVVQNRDFEDAVVAGAAERGACDCIVTRNVADSFLGSPVRILTPEEFLGVLAP
jgi:hypothetical protein